MQRWNSGCNIDEGWKLAQYSLIMQLMQMRSLIMQLMQMRYKGGTQHNIINYATCADEVDSTWQMRVNSGCNIHLPWNPNFTIQLAGTLQNEGNFIQYSGYSHNC